MDTQFAMLGLLDRGPNYGYQLKKLFDDLALKARPLHVGQVYAVLSRLQQKGAVHEILDTHRREGPQRVKYEITDHGRSLLNSWLSSVDEPTYSLKSTLHLKTTIALLRGDDAFTYMDQQKTAHIAAMRKLTEERRHAEPVEKSLLDYSLLHLEADLKWMDITALRIQSKEQM